MNGTSNMTSSTVFIEKRYRFEDIFIGWEFAGLLYLKDSSRGDRAKEVMVDLKLIHDILPQTSGGNEPLGDAGLHHSRQGISRSLLAAV